LIGRIERAIFIVIFWPAIFGIILTRAHGAIFSHFYPVNDKIAI
jgi:hypothetical protein